MIRTLAIFLALAFLAGCHFTPRPPRRSREQVERDRNLKSYHNAKATVEKHRKNSLYIDHRGFFNTFANYAVTFTEPEKQLFIDESWKLENWGCEDQHFEYCATPQQKTGLLYRGVRLVDRDADGTSEKEWEYFFDLKLTNRKDASEIWVSTYDLPADAKDTLLEVFLNNYADSLGGAELQIAGDPRGYAQIKQRKFVTMIDAKEAITIGPYEAVQADIVIRDIDKLKLDDTHVHSRVRVLITRVDCDDALMTYGKSGPTGIVSTSGKALMVVGYSNTQEFFEASLGGYKRFLKRFVFKKWDR